MSVLGPWLPICPCQKNILVLQSLLHVHYFSSKVNEQGLPHKVYSHFGPTTCVVLGGPLAFGL